MPWVNEFLLRRKKGELGVSRRRLAVKRRGKNQQAEGTEGSAFFQKRSSLSPSTEGGKRSRDEEGLSEVGARLCPSPQ